VVRKLALAAAVVVLSGLGSQCRADTELRRVVPRDDETVVGRAALWKNNSGQCSMIGTPDMEIITQPSHGSARIVPASFAVSEGGCVNQVYGLVVLYRPASGFVGEDRFTYSLARDAMTQNWVSKIPPGLRNLILTVR